jgi:hypothetical protein
MMSPRSRGKGSRRLPWRDGGRRKQKVAEWRKQATHAVEALTELTGELVRVHYHSPFGQKPGESIYRFDQEAARSSLRYFAELGGYRRAPVFTLHVPVDQAAAVQAIVARLRRQ